jgi:hypothetical protein
MTLTDLVNLSRSPDPEKRALAQEVAKLIKISVELIDELRAVHSDPPGCVHGQLMKAEQDRDAARRDWARAHNDGSADAGTDFAVFRNLRIKYGNEVAEQLMPKTAQQVKNANG